MQDVSIDRPDLLPVEAPTSSGSDILWSGWELTVQAWSGGTPNDRITVLKIDRPLIAGAQQHDAVLIIFIVYNGFRDIVQCFRRLEPTLDSPSADVTDEFLLRPKCMKPPEL